MAARRACASMRCPRSRSASSKPAASMSAEAASGCVTAGMARGSAAVAAAETNMEFMRDIQESGNGMNRWGALSDPIRLTPVPAVLSLSCRRGISCVRGCFRRQIGLEGVARREMAEGRHHKVAVVTPDGAEDVAWFAGYGVRAFDEREIAGGGGAQQRVEVGAGIVRNAHGGSPKMRRARRMAGLDELEEEGATKAAP